MSSPTRYIPFNPVRFRLAFFLSGVVCAAITGWALYNAAQSTERLAEARGGISAGLMFAFFYAFVRLRPRAGWGVEVEPLRIVVARPFRGEPTKLLWAEVQQVLLGGKKRNVLLLFLESGGRIAIPRQLFAKESEFRELVDLAREKVPPMKFDA